MTYHPDPPQQVCVLFALADPVHVAETSIANVWKVQFDGRDAALKIYKNCDMKDEARGFDLLDALNGHGAVKIYARDGAAIVMEWLGGPSLADMARTGKDQQATVILAQTAQTIHAQRPAIQLRTLSDKMQRLINFNAPAQWPKVLRRNMRRAQAIAADLLETSTESVALHGDLHHDNIKEGTRGFLAFDAKGLIGDPAYEVANAFQNPMGDPHIFGRPERIEQMADHFAQIMAVPKPRILGWAVVHCAISMLWSGDLPQNPRVEQLGLLLSAYDSGR